MFSDSNCDPPSLKFHSATPRPQQVGIQNPNFATGSATKSCSWDSRTGIKGSRLAQLAAISTCHDATAMLCSPPLNNQMPVSTSQNSQCCRQVCLQKSAMPTSFVVTQCGMHTRCEHLCTPSTTSITRRVLLRLLPPLHAPQLCVPNR